MKIDGADALSMLEDRRARYETSGEYPFLIGNSKDLGFLQEAVEFSEQVPKDIIRVSLNIDLGEWIARSRAEAEKYEFSTEDVIGQWPDEGDAKESISRYKADAVLSKKIIPEMHLGIAAIEHPWHLPAVLNYGGWNDCPDSEVHCAFHRKWQAEYGAQIFRMSGDVIECIVSDPPHDQQSAIDLAWQHYWYCNDCVDQICDSVSNLAAVLLNSKYWYFWWD